MEIQKNKQSLECILPKRTKGPYSNNFREIPVHSNHFQVRLIQDFDQLHIFSMKFEPSIPHDNRIKRKEIILNIWNDIRSFIDNPAICGMNIISNREPSSQSKQFNSGDFIVSIKRVKTLETKTNPNALLFFLNNRFRNVMSQTGYAQIGRTGKYFNIKHRKQIDDLNMYSGFKANFCYLQRGIFLRVDSAKKIVRNQTVLDHINQLYQKNESKDRQDKRNIVRNSLKDQIIQVNYGNGRYYKIQDIVYKELSEVFLQGQKINIVDYYKSKYNITITKLKQPLLKIENRKGTFQILLLPELCLMTGIPEDFDEFKRKKISEHTILDAATKRKQILSVMDQVRKTEDFDNLNKIGIQLSRKMYQLNSKSIPVPRLMLGEDQKVQQGKQSFFNLFNQPIYANKHKIKLAILYIRADLRDLIQTFQNTSKNLKVQLQYEKFEIRDQRRFIEQIGFILKKAIQKGCNIALIVIPPHMKSQYKRIKEASLIDNKIVSQVACETNLRKKNSQSIATKILLQIIAKKGNTLWVPQTKAKIQEVMLVGVDTAALSGGKNILAACGTVNSTFTSIYSKNIDYEGLQGKFQAMRKVILDIVNYSVGRNSVPPKEIIMFLNSCSYEQIRSLKQYFVDEFVRQSQQIYGQKSPSLQVVMVNTKTSSRFFTPKGQNVRAGTLINSQIVSKQYDFYLVSQNTNRGCILPNHYKVVFTNSNMEEGILQELIFAQCFNYVNWSGSIKIPGILQYAKKCAKFNSEVMQENKVTESLERCLYFI